MAKDQYIENWKRATPFMVYCVVVYTFGDVLFGLDVGSFGSIQTLPAWLDAFGETIDGVRTLSTSRRAAMNSCVFVGKFVGTMSYEPVVERFGFKIVMFAVCSIQMLGVVLELATTNWIAFTVGRCLAYLAVGLVGAASPSFTADIVPAPLRGTCAGSLILFNALGNLWGAGMGRAYATEQRPIGWYVPVGVQFIPALIILMGLPFTCESPRWLLSKGRKGEAIKALDRLRPAEDSYNGTTSLEAEAIERAIVESRNAEGGRWIDLARGTYFRRTMVATFVFVFQQITAQQFIGSYGPTFYRQFDLQEQAFTFQVITLAVTVVACGFTLPLYDRFGRRQINVIGTFLQIPFMGLVAGFGTKAANTGQLTGGDTAGVVLGMVGANASVKISLSTLAYVLGSEIGGTIMRKKVFAFALTVDVVAAFGVTFTTPYLLGDPGANLGGRIGWLFFAYCVASFLFVLFFLPELKGRSLEETDELFEMNLWAWQFAKARTTGVGAAITDMEAHRLRDRNDKSVEGDSEDVEQGKARPTEIEDIERGRGNPRAVT